MRESRISCLLHTPYWGCACNQGTCPWPELNLGPFSPQTDALSTEPNRFRPDFQFLKYNQRVWNIRFSLLPTGIPALSFFPPKSIFNLRNQSDFIKIKICWNRFGSVDRASACGLKGPGFDSGQGHVPWLQAHPQWGMCKTTKVHALDWNQTWDLSVHRPTLYLLSQTGFGRNTSC